MSIAWPEVGGLSPLLFLGFVPLLYVEDFISNETGRAKSRRLLPFSFTAFFTWNLLTTWWVYYASAGGMAMAVFFNSLFMAGIFSLFHWTKRKVGIKEGYIGLIIYWIGWEYWHMQWDLTWPWLTLGNGFANDITWIQWYEYTGVFGGGLWALTINILLFLVIKKTFLSQQKWTTAWPILVAIVLILVGPLVTSQIIYNGYEETEDPVEIVVIQPNIDPYNEKFNGMSPAEQLDKILNLGSSMITPNTKYVVAPETALPRSLWEHKIEESAGYQGIKSFVLLNPGIQFVIGLSSKVAYYTKDEVTATSRKERGIDVWKDYFNSAMQVDERDSVQFYHKSKLVPGVERMPYPALFKPLETFAIDLGGSSGSMGTQEERTVFTSSEGRGIAPVICYESIYGEYVGEYVKNGAELIFIITNDGWWDDTPGYKQHLAYARMRAIETRRSIARSANTGTSCFINQRGEISQATDWWVPAALRESINANSHITFYVQYGDFIARTSLLFSGLLILLTLVRTFSSKKGLNLK